MILSSNASTDGSVNGGSSRSVHSDASANRNSVTISDDVYVDSVVYGGSSSSNYANGTANLNSVEILGGSIAADIRGGYAYSGRGNATASENAVTLAASASTEGAIHGGHAFANAYAYSEMGSVASAIAGDGDSSRNTVSVSGSVQTDVHGGHINMRANAKGIMGNARAVAGNASANNNVVAVSDGATIGGTVYGGYTAVSVSATGEPFIIGGGSGGGSSNYASAVSGDATANENTVTISDSASVGGSVYGGYVTTSATAGSETESLLAVSAAASASSNTVTVSGGMIGGDVYGGFASSATGIANATNNTVNLHSEADLRSSTVYGGYASGSAEDSRTGNTLNVHGHGLIVKGVENFQKYHFHVDADISADGTVPVMLTITDNELLLMAGDTGIVDLGALVGDLGLYDRLDILYAAASIADGAEDAVWTVINYAGTAIIGDELIAFWQDDTLRVGWASTVPEPSIAAALLGLIALGTVRILRRKDRCCPCLR